MKPPLKTVLKNFLNHFEDYEGRKKCSDDQYEYEFQQLKKLTDRLKDDPEYNSSCALKDVNRPKNRYKDIVPYDKSRVILPKCDGIPGSDYINASYVKGASGAFAYIAAQGPLPNTVIDFWRMVWVCEVQVLIMACNEKEAGKSKCEKYWPLKSEINHYGNISVELIESDQICPDFIMRTFLVKCDSEMRDVYQFHYTSWPDHGVPITVHPILELVRLMREYQPSETNPIVVHCSAGCGRTGTICAVDYVWACLRHGKLAEDFSLFQIALELRRQRIAMIQTKEQYILAHRAVATLFEQQLTVIDCHIYVNIDEDGEPLMLKELSRDKLPNFKTEKHATNENSVFKHNDLSNDRKEKISLRAKGSTEDLVKKDALNSSVFSSVEDVDKNSLVDNKLSAKMSASDSLINSENSFSRNSYLSQQSNDDSIPFIDDDDICVRPNCGRAYLNIPSVDSISKLMNHFDPFVDKVTADDDSSPDADPTMSPEKLQDFQTKCEETNENSAALGSSETSEDVDKGVNCYATFPAKSSRSRKFPTLNNRESYPPSASGLSYFHEDSASDLREESSASLKAQKKVGRATVVRRPSISKLKALFEKSGLGSNKSSNEGGKRSLFRHNSHNVSRAGSAPPSLNCMDQHAASERESILMLVTRKFRSASVRNEREISSKPYDKTMSKKSTTGTMLNFKEGFANLSRNVSFSLSRTFRSYSPAKSKSDKGLVTSGGHISFVVDNAPSERSQEMSPDMRPRGNSLWYDRSSAPRAIAVVKPTEKTCKEHVVDVPQSPTAKSVDRNTLSPTSCKAPKVLPFLSTLSKTNGKDATTMWYNQTTETSLSPTGHKVICETDVESTKIQSKYRGKSFIQAIAPWKKTFSKSPLTPPENPKNSIEIKEETNNPGSTSTFYTRCDGSSDKVDNSNGEKACDSVVACPVPEEIIPLNIIDCNQDVDSPVSSSKIPKDYTSEKPCDSIIQTELPTKSIEICIDKTGISSETETIPKLETISKSETIPKIEMISKTETIPKNDTVSKMEAVLNTETVSETETIVDIPPAIPKKMNIGRNKQFENQMFLKEHESIPDQAPAVNDNANKPAKENDLLANRTGRVVELPPASPKDHYINVNLKTLKNIEQIENTLRNNPRGAIIDLTSRESYCMEEELDDALKQFSNTPEKGKNIGTKNITKIPGYEVIWPETNCTKDGCSPSYNIVKSLPGHDPEVKERVISENCQKGICYSPPLRRSINASMSLAKCRSCSNIDWLQPGENVSMVGNYNDSSSNPTKKLVNEAVVELNTLLDKLTTRTYEEPEFNCNMNEITPVDKNVNKVSFNGKERDKASVTLHSVTLFPKCNASNSSPKEEEIVFHFPPPPPLPPPEDDTPSEVFNIVRKNGSLVVSDTPKTVDSTTEVNYKDLNLVGSPFDSDTAQPRPAPRRSKQTPGLRRSASYTNICVSQNKTAGYENVFLEKLQTLSRLQIDESQNRDGKPSAYGKPQSGQASKHMAKKLLPNYVNINELSISDSLAPGHAGEKDIKMVPNTVLQQTDMSRSCPPSAVKASPTFRLEEEAGNGDSTYGKICKIVEKKYNPVSKISQEQLYIGVEDAKKKPVPSKKSERAPLPPEVFRTKEGLGKGDCLKSVKKLPSRKLEKAPLPPPLLQKSSSAISVAKKNLPNYANFSLPRTHPTQEASGLSALRENILNTDLPDSVVGANRMTKELRSQSLGRGLSHSQSDASVFCALKERKKKSVNSELQGVDTKPHFRNRILKNSKELVSVSSSDSDGSYERIYFDKPADYSVRDLSKRIKEQIILSSAKGYKKDMPIAPPRSKRRSTTEIHYAKVKSKEASTASAMIQDHEFSEKVLAFAEPPPAIPLKTKEAFEVMNEFSIKGGNKYVDDAVYRYADSSSKR